MRGRGDFEVLNKIVGTRVRSMTKGHGSFLTLELTGGIPPRASGDVSLWVYLCSWSLISGGEAVTDNNSVSEKTDFGLMVGKVFENYDFIKGTNRFVLNFSDTTSITLLPDLLNYESDDDLFRITLAGEGTYGYSPSEGWQS